MSCIVKNCENNRWMGDNTITFHRFPKKPAKRTEWAQNCGLDEENLKPASLICSEHFALECFKVRDGRYRILSSNARPTIFGKTRPIVPAGQTSGVAISCAVVEQDSIMLQPTVCTPTPPTEGQAPVFVPVRRQDPHPSAGIERITSILLPVMEASIAEPLLQTGVAVTVTNFDLVGDEYDTAIISSEGDVSIDSLEYLKHPTSNQKENDDFESSTSVRTSPQMDDSSTETAMKIRFSSDTQTTKEVESVICKKATFKEVKDFICGPSTSKRQSSDIQNSETTPAKKKKMAPHPRAKITLKRAMHSSSLTSRSPNRNVLRAKISVLKSALNKKQTLVKTLQKKNCRLKKKIYTLTEVLMDLRNKKYFRR